MLRLFAFFVAGLLSAMAASAAPSFDCTKAQSAAEKAVCEVPDLSWSDRQLARFYKLALGKSGTHRAELVESQRQFLSQRDACRDDTECLDKAYKTRFGELAPKVDVHDAFGVFEPKEMGGEMWIVRFGGDAAFKILTVGGGGHTCTVDADSAPQGGKGIVRYRGKGANACRIDLIPDGDEIVVKTRNCSEYCGVRAVLDDRYERAK